MHRDSSSEGDATRVASRGDVAQGDPDTDVATSAVTRRRAQSDECGEATAVAARRRVDDRVMLADVAVGLFASADAQEKVGRFVVIDRIGAGAMGSVYCAYDPRLDRRIALKVIAAHALDAGMSGDRLLREATALARINHPNVVAVYEAGRVGSDVYLAMELVHGMSLAEWSSRSPLRGSDRRRTTLDVLCQAARGLVAAHRAKLVHRDFKPGNVLVGSDGRVRVADFGLARAVPGGTGTFDRPRGVELERFEPTKTGFVVGTPRYMAPEQRAGAEIDARADQFAFCVTAWEVLWGQHPFGDEAPGPEPLAPPPGAPRKLVDALRQGLRLEPHARHASMDVLLSRLEACRSGRSPIVWLGLAGVLVLAAGAATWMLVRDGADAPAASRSDRGGPVVAAEPLQPDASIAASAPLEAAAAEVEAPGTRPPDADAAVDPGAEPPPQPSASSRSRAVVAPTGRTETDDEILARVRAVAQRKCRLQGGPVELTVDFLIERTGRPALLRSSPADTEVGRCVENELRTARFRPGPTRRAALRVSWPSPR